MKVANEQSVTRLVDGLKTIFENRTYTEAQALASTSANTIYYTSDTHKIVVGGHVYGMGSIPIASDTALGGIELALGNLGSSITGYCDQFGESEYHLMLKEATTSNSGAMTSAMVTKLNGIEAGANNYTLPDATTSTKGGVKVGSGLGVSSATVSLNTPNMPIYMDGNGKLTIALGAAMEVSSSTASWKFQTSKGLDVDTSGAKVKLGTGMDFDSNGNIKPVADYGVKVDTGGIQLNLYDNGGLMLANAGHQVSVKAGSNIIVSSSGVSVDTDSSVTQNGTKPPTSGAVYTAIANATPNIEIMTQAEVATVGANVFGF